MCILHFFIFFSGAHYLEIENQWHSKGMVNCVYTIGALTTNVHRKIVIRKWYFYFIILLKQNLLSMNLQALKQEYKMY